MKTTTLATAAGIVALGAIAAQGIVVTSDPLGRMNGTPVAGTTSTASSATAAAVLDVRAKTSVDLDGWVLSTLPSCTVLYLR